MRLGLGDPLTDDRRVAAGIQGGPVLGELAVVTGDLFAQAGDLGRKFVLLGGGECVDRGGQVRGAERGAEPGVEGGDDLGFAQVHRARVEHVVGAGVFVRVGAPVVGLVVVPAALHPPVADPAEQQAAQDVRARGRARAAHDLAGVLGREQLLRALKGVSVDHGRVNDLIGEDPLVVVVPPHLGGVAECDVGDIDEDLVLALAVPDLAAGVARVAQDRANGALGPGQAAAVRVAFWVVRGWRSHPIAGQPFGDREDAVAGEELGEDPPHHNGGWVVERQSMQALAVRGLGRVRVRSGVDEPVPVGRPTAEVAALKLSLRSHGGADADLDPVPLALGHPTEHGHNQVVRFVVGIDWPAHLGHPQRHAVVGEDREGVAELVPVERPLRLADRDCVEPAFWVGERGEQGARLGPALRRDRAGLVDVEEFGDDPPAVRLDESLGPGELPPA